MSPENQLITGIRNAIILIIVVPIMAQVVVDIWKTNFDLTIISAPLSLIVGILIASESEVDVSSTLKNSGMVGIFGFFVIFFYLQNWLGIIIQLSCLIGPYIVSNILGNKG